MQDGQHTISAVAFEDLLAQLEHTYIIKNSDYGSSASKTYAKFGPVSYLIRLNDKLNRLEELILRKDGEAKVQDETVKDTLMDLAGYALLAVLDMTPPGDS